jgi:S1-C subfamily serine protease
MAANSLLKQYSDERAALVQNALPKAVAVVLGRRRVISGIHWSGDLIVTAAEAIGGADHVDVRLDGDELGAEVIATDLTTDVAILRAASGDTASTSTHSGSSASTTPGDPAIAGGTAPAAVRSSAPPTSPASALRVGETIAVIGRSLRGPTAIWGSVQLAGPAWNSRRGGKIDQRIELDVGFDP